MSEQEERPSRNEGRTLSPEAVSAANFHLNDNGLLPSVLRFAAGGNDYLNVVLVCRKWKHVADANFLKESAVLHKMNQKSQRKDTITEKDLGLLTILFEWLKNRNSPLYKPPKSAAAASAHGVEKWPRLKSVRLRSTLYTFAYGISTSSHMHCGFSPRMTYDVVKQFFISLCQETVEFMESALKRHYNDLEVSTATDFLKCFFNQWLKWEGILRHVIKTVHWLNEHFVKRLKIDDYDSLENLAEITMARSMVRSSSLVTQNFPQLVEWILAVEEQQRAALQEHPFDTKTSLDESADLIITTFKENDSALQLLRSTLHKAQEL